MTETTPLARPSTGLPPMGLVALLVGLTGLRLAVAGLAGLTDDESYYRLWSLTLQAGYYDHAPMVAWWIRAGRELVGDSALGLRLLAPLATFAGSLLLWRAVAVLDGRAVATRAVLWFNAAVLIGAGSVLMTPDTPSVFFWGATLWALAELSAPRKPAWWLLVGLAAGLGLFSKYSVLFLGLGIVLWLVAIPANRRWFASWQLWVGGAIALLLFAPVVLWNADHGWISFQKQFGRTVPHGFRPEKLAEMLGVQWLLLGLPLAPLAVLGTARAARRFRDDPAAGLIVATSAPFVLYLLFHSLHGGVEGNWPAPLYAGFAWAAARVASGEGASRFVEGARRVVVPLGFALSGLLYLHAVHPLVVLPPERDPTAQMRGWDDFAARVEAERQARGAAWIAVPSYTLTGQFTRRLGTDHVVQLDERERYAHLAPPDPAMLARPALFVTRARRDVAERYRDRFAAVEKLGTIDRTVEGKVVDTYDLWLFSGAKGDPRR